MGASDEVRRELLSDWLFGNALNDAATLERSLEQMDPSERLIARGLATISYGGSLGADKAPITYYLATERGTYFAVARKAGFMKTERIAEFVSHADISRTEYIAYHGMSLRCYRANEKKHFLYFSLEYLEHSGGGAAQLAALTTAMGQNPVDVTVEVFPRARYER